MPRRVVASYSARSKYIACGHANELLPFALVGLKSGPISQKGTDGYRRGRGKATVCLGTSQLPCELKLKVVIKLLSPRSPKVKVPMPLIRGEGGDLEAKPTEGRRGYTLFISKDAQGSKVQRGLLWVPARAIPYTP